MYKGSYVAIVTPFKDGDVDEMGLRKNLRFLIENGTSGIVACATTGESPSLSEDEYERIIKICLEECNGKIPVIAGAGTNSTLKTIKTAELAQKIGANGLLVVTPYYNKPTQQGLYQHYKELSRSTDLPIIIYNVPGRTGVNILPQTVAKLAHDCKNIVGIKEASGNLDQVSELISLLGDDFDVLSGDDSLTLPMLILGAKGVISVIANIFPRDVSDMCNYFFEGKFEKARQLHIKMFPVVKALFIETNPIPVKKAMELMGLPAGNPRLPLVSMSEENVQILRKRLIEYGVAIC
jgi:4-hydroxy-tetrahydrodipicolinate synthase|uniref:4-hydroxy-tetrahydrodipicolinate synthase n=1 Tax=candidate division WOR-3 bacterium TaxID=2052148 RepID=A0A7C4XV75_UNCW3